MTGWAVALILYVLPILSRIRHFDEEVEAVKEWMRTPEGEWYPEMAPWCAALGIALWPLVAAIDAVIPEEKR